jgi:hypothetical protein
VTRTSHQLIWLVPSNQVSNFHYHQPWTLVDNGGHHARVRRATALTAWPGNWLRDEEAAGSNPDTPIEKFQLDGMIAKRGDHAILDRVRPGRWC